MNAIKQKSSYSIKGNKHNILFEKREIEAVKKA
jgi:hypothetical protein